MSITFGTPVWLSPGRLVRVPWTSDVAEASFYVYRDGVFLFLTKNLYGDFSVSLGETLNLEVFDAETDIPTALPSRVTLGWWAVPDAQEYRIEEFVGAVWTLRQTIPAGVDAFHTWRTRVLEDSTTHQFRILAVDAAGNDSLAETLSFFMVRIPDAPNVEASWDDPTLTLTAT